ncbi:MAG: L-2-hydroxyglutarate oxidase, partial [Candidatus Omnitrophica bacterium]|nr:L-2-hydroxyglutarate oxidase [Candidatus Omnitrophota bacterium]
WKLLARPEFLQLAWKNAMVSCSRRAFFQQIAGLIQPLRFEQVVPARSGIRAQMVDRQGGFVNDLLVERAANSTHVLNAVSPGMTSSLAFAEYLLEEYIP